MSAVVAIGVGCRRGCEAQVIEALVRQALERVPSSVVPVVAPLNGASIKLFTIADKCDEVGLLEAAHRLGLALVLLPRAALRDQTPFVQTCSPHSRRRFDVPSVAEAAALAGAGSGAVLIVPRIALDSATCAIAGSAEGTA